MRSSVMRRATKLTAGLAVLTMLMSGCAGDGEEGSSGRVTVGIPAGGAGQLVLDYAIENGLPEEYGIDLEYTTYNSLPTMFTDFAAGKFDTVFISPESLLGMAQKGVPVRLVGTLSPSHMSVVAKSPIDDPSAMAGMRVVVPTGSVSVELVIAALKEWYGVDLREDSELLTARSMGDGLAQVSAGTADAAIGWETAVTSVSQASGSTIAYSFEKDWQERTGGEYWMNAVAQRTGLDASDESIDDFMDMLAAAGEALVKDAAMADEFAVETQEIDPGVYEEALSTGRLTYQVGPVDDEVRGEIELAFKMESDAGALNTSDIPDTFWGETP